MTMLPRSTQPLRDVKSISEKTARWAQTYKLTLMQRRLLVMVLDDYTSEQMMDATGLKYSGVYYHLTKMFKVMGVNGQKGLRRLYRFDP